MVTDLSVDEVCEDFGGTILLEVQKMLEGALESVSESLVVAEGQAQHTLHALLKGQQIVHQNLVPASTAAATARGTGTASGSSASASSASASASGSGVDEHNHFSRPPESEQ